MGEEQEQARRCSKAGPTAPANSSGGGVGVQPPHHRPVGGTPSSIPCPTSSPPAPQLQRGSHHHTPVAAAETSLQPPEHSSVLPVAMGNEAAAQQAHKLAPSTGHIPLPRCPETQVTGIQHQHQVPQAKVTRPPLPCPGLSLPHVELTAAPSPN